MTLAAASAPVPVAWLVARAAGLVALGLLGLSLWLGLAMSCRLFAPRRQKLLLQWHQTLMWCGLSMVALHGVSLLLDPVMRFSVTVILVPGLAPWRPVAVAAGVVTAWLMLSLAVSFHVRRRIGQARWRLLHYAGFAAFALALGHALTAGTDLRGTTGLLVAGGLSAPVLWLVYVRILASRLPVAERRSPPTPSHPRASADRAPAGVA